MQANILKYVLHILASVAFTQTVEPIRIIPDGAFLSSPSSKEPNLRSEPETSFSFLGRRFPSQKSAQTDTPHEREDLLRKIKPARELNTFVVPEHDHDKHLPLSMLSFSANFDNDSAAVIDKNIQNYNQYGNKTKESLLREKGRETSGIFDSVVTDTPQTYLITNEINITTEKFFNHETIKMEKDYLPPEVTLTDQFTTTMEKLTDLAVSATQIHMNSLNTSFEDTTFTNFTYESNSIWPFDSKGNITVEIDSTSTSETTGKFEAVPNLASSLQESGHETSTPEPVNETMIIISDFSTTPKQMSHHTTVVAIETQLMESEVTSQTSSINEQKRWTTQSSDVNAIAPDDITTANVASSVKYNIFSGSETKTFVKFQPPIVASTSFNQTMHPKASFRSSEEDASTFETGHELSLSAATTISSSKTVPIVFNEFAKATHEHENSSENLFVGDKTLFSQDNTMKALQDFITSNPISTSAIHSESEATKEEDFGIPAFPIIERPGPEATEETHKLVGIGSSIDMMEGHSGLGEIYDDKHTSNEQTYPKIEKIPERNNEWKDISITDDDSFHIQADLKESAHIFKPIIHEGSEFGATEQPKSTSESLPTTKENSVKSTVDGVFYTHHTYVKDSASGKEESYNTPFSFRITSIDYTPEFGDPDSGRYKKLQNQLLPDLEEIFGSVFNHEYEGVHLVSFMKGSVMVEGVVYTLTKPNDLEQLATEFEQQVVAKNSRIGGNDVDPRSISLSGYISKNHLKRIHEGYTSNNTSSFIVGSGIAIGILTVLLIAFAVIAMNNRRTNGTLKLKEENIKMTENVPSSWKCDTPISYKKDRNVQGNITNGQPPMVMFGSQMTSIYMNDITPSSTKVTTLVVNDENSEEDDLKSNKL